MPKRASARETALEKGACKKMLACPHQHPNRPGHLGGAGHGRHWAEGVIGRNSSPVTSVAGQSEFGAPLE
eukprot:14567-Alexandrium_andersonii.AAC.1